jgi:hypothetical protein
VPSAPNEVRGHLAKVCTLLQPFTFRTGDFPDLPGVRIAIELSFLELNRANGLVAKLNGDRP